MCGDTLLAKERCGPRRASEKCSRLTDWRGGLRGDRVARGWPSRVLMQHLCWSNDPKVARVVGRQHSVQCRGGDSDLHGLDLTRPGSQRIANRAFDPAGHHTWRSAILFGSGDRHRADHARGLSPGLTTNRRVHRLRDRGALARTHRSGSFHDVPPQRPTELGNPSSCGGGGKAA
jgi:hypothetical protein